MIRCTDVMVELRQMVSQLGLEADGIIARGADEIGRLREEARRFYRADGTYEVLNTPEEVIARRIEAAREIEQLRADIANAVRLLYATRDRIIDNPQCALDRLIGGLGDGPCPLPDTEGEDDVSTQRDSLLRRDGP